MPVEHRRPDGSLAQGYFCGTCGAAGVNMVGTGHGIGKCTPDPALVRALHVVNGNTVDPPAGPLQGPPMTDKPTPPLAHCPFCGEGSVVMHPNDIAPGGSAMATQDGAQVQYAHCDGCGAEGPQAFDGNEAIAAWNRRATPPLSGEVQRAPQDVIDRAIKCLDHWSQFQSPVGIRGVDLKHAVGVLRNLAAVSAALSAPPQDGDRCSPPLNVTEAATALIDWQWPDVAHDPEKSMRLIHLVSRAILAKGSK